MNSRIAVVPGSFDPPTLGHLDVIRRAAVALRRTARARRAQPRQRGDAAHRPAPGLLEQSIAEGDVDGNVIVASWSMGLLVDYATDVGAGVLVKGIRSQVDVAYETPMAIVNRHLAHVETVFLLPDPAHALVSSSLVRQVAASAATCRRSSRPPSRASSTPARATAARAPGLGQRRAGSMETVRTRPGPSAPRARHRAPPR